MLEAGLPSHSVSFSFYAKDLINEGGSTLKSFDIKIKSDITAAMVSALVALGQPGHPSANIRDLPAGSRL